MKFSEYVDENEFIIARLRKQFLKRGIQLSELELWQYVNWCHEGVRQYMMGISQEVTTLVTKVTVAVAEQNAAMFTGERTGIFPPPNPETRFENPEEAAALLAKHGRKPEQSPASATFEDLHDSRAARNYL